MENIKLSPKELTAEGGIYITDTTSSEYDFTGETVPGLLTELKVNIDQTAPDVVTVVPADTTPPMITVISPVTSTFSRAEVIPLQVDIRDLESGVQSQEIKFDDTIVNATEIIDLFFQSLGVHTLSITATDRVGNTTSTQMVWQVAATPESTILDIERAFSLGWITRPSIKDFLVERVRKIITFEKKIKFLEEKLAGKPRIIKRIERVEKRIDRILARIILAYLELQNRRGFINTRALQLLQEDIYWLLNNN